jgi:hypothetical protein
MTSKFSDEKLRSLRARTSESLQRYSRNRLAVSQSSMALGSREHGRGQSLSRSDGKQLEIDQSGLAPKDAGLSATGAKIGDERQVRAVAKELKRLIVEDRRRGLGVGG